MKRKSKLRIIEIIILIVLLIGCRKSFADVGSFESYDSGSSWSSSDYSSGSSWSSYDDDWSYSSSGGSSSGYSSSPTVVVVGTLVMVVIMIAIMISRKNNYNYSPRIRVKNYQVMPEEQVEKKIKEIDPLFNREEFLSWTSTIFIKLQEAWTDRDWSVIRTIESNELFEQHQKQLQGYIDNNQINVMERICVKSVRLESFEQIGDKDVLKVVLNSKMIDYIIDATTKQILKGDRVTERHSTYRLTFIRKTGTKTKPGSSQINTTNCPNCGAPTQITSSGKCEYCGSIITTDDHGWVLSNLTKIG